MLEFLRPFPVSALIPVAIAVLGLSDGMVVDVVVFGSLWPVALATTQAFASVEPRLYEVARAPHMSRFAPIRRIALPSAAPDIRRADMPKPAETGATLPGARRFRRNRAEPPTGSSCGPAAGTTTASLPMRAPPQPR